MTGIMPVCASLVSLLWNKEALLVVFSTSLGLATISLVTIFRRYEGLRRFTFRFLIAMIAFGFGVFVTT